MKNGNNESSPFCEAKGGRGERSEPQGVHTVPKPPVTLDDNPVIPDDAPVIPANAGTQRKTKHTASPPLSLREGGARSHSDLAGDARDGNGQFPSPSMGEGEGGKPTPNLDVEAARKSLDRMANIFADIAKHAEDSTLQRCPYKDAKSRCTAKFACDNQHFTKNPLDPPACTARDGDLNYRSAWQI